MNSRVDDDNNKYYYCLFVFHSSLHTKNVVQSSLQRGTKDKQEQVKS